MQPVHPSTPPCLTNVAGSSSENPMALNPAEFFNFTLYGLMEGTHCLVTRLVDLSRIRSAEWECMHGCYRVYGSIELGSCASEMTACL